MTGASGSFYSSDSNYTTGEVRLIVNWTQTYNPGDSYSTVTISAKLQRMYDYTTQLGGTWYAWSTGGVKVNGTRAVSWYEKSTAIGLANPGTVGWSASGSVKVSHTAATTIPIAIEAISWHRTGYSSGDVDIPAKTVKVTLQAVPQAYRFGTTGGDDGCVLSVRRTDSPLAGADSGTLSDGATVYDGDVLQVYAVAFTGYDLQTITVNGNSMESGGSFTVSGTVSAAATSAVKTFLLKITEGAHSDIQVIRDTSPIGGGTTGILSDGETLYYNDTLTVNAEGLSGYGIDTLTVNGESVTTGYGLTAKADVTVVSTAKALGLVYIYDGQQWLPYQVFVWDGQWQQYAPYVYDGGWNMMS